MTFHVNTKCVMDGEWVFIAWDHNGVNVKCLPCTFEGVYDLDVTNVFKDFSYKDIPKEIHVYNIRDYFNTIWPSKQCWYLKCVILLWPYKMHIFCKWRIDEFPHVKQVNHNFYFSNFLYLRNCKFVFEWFFKNMDHFLSVDKVSPSLSKKRGGNLNNNK